MGIMDGIEAGKTAIEIQKSWMEIEQQRMAERLQTILTDEGYPCHIENDGEYRINGLKISKLKIIPERQLSIDEQKEFERLKEKYAKTLGIARKKELKEEKKKLKAQK